MNDILHLVTVYEVLIYCQTIQGVGGYWKEESDNEGLFISSWSGSAGYSAEMLTEDGKSWQVEDESTLASSVSIEAEYPALADHEEIA